MEQIDLFLLNVKNLVWSTPLLLLLLGTGIYLTIILKGVQFRYLGYAFKQVFAPEHKDSEGDISHFQSLMTTLAGAIGTGTIVGVATAITVGGLGSMFWMWVTAFLGMATKYAESLLAVKYRSLDEKGEMIGGPMQYIEKGLGWKWMAILFAVFGVLAAIGTGNLVQVNAISESINHVWAVNPWVTGFALAVITGLVVVGGVKSIGNVAGVLVPLMALFYMIGGLIILVIHADRIPEAFSLIISSAFNGQAAIGGFAGSTVMLAVQMGVSRSVFSNEAGLGISSIAAASAKTDSPGRQAMINMTGALISTVIVCSVTGLVLAVTGLLGSANDDGTILTGAPMAIKAFSSTIYGGEYIVSIGLILFAFSTVIAWALYGEKCAEYIFGIKGALIYRVIYTLIIIPGAALKMELAWLLADIMNGLMVIPNLIALIALSGVIISETNTFIKIIKKET
jgi:AGCS family alanine or glycine:cation symporter